MSPETAHPHGVTKSGDMVRLEYDLWAEGGGKTELVDTTHQEVAQEAKVQIPDGAKWGPRPHLVGGEYFPGAIEAAITGAKVGEEFEREFAPADAFGERDPNLIELFSMHEISRLPEMRRDDAHLDIGTVLTIEGRRGRVVTLTAARVRVDFNPPYSGRKVKAKFKVVDRITDPVDQARGIVELTYGRGSEFHIESHEKSLTLKIPDRSKFDISWMAAKPRVIDRLRSQLHPETIRIVEEYVTPKAEKSEAKDEPKESSAKAKDAADAEPTMEEHHAHAGGKSGTKSEAKDEPKETHAKGKDTTEAEPTPEGHHAHAVGKSGAKSEKHAEKTSSEKDA
jgi:FKBP-type peptidyl-prolyl cis-trans isomerase 2